MALQRIDESPHELVVVKPAGLPSELPRDAGADSLIRRLAREDAGDLRLVHRLDAPACGVMVVARSIDAAAHYSAEIAARRWHKWYVARVAVRAEAAQALVGTHKAYLKTEGRLARVVQAGGKPSWLDVVSAAPAARGARVAVAPEVTTPSREPHDPIEAGATTDLLIRLHTGRFHQIRVMLAHLGAPLVGDTRYGGPAAPSMYLEHVMVAARPFRRDAWRVWMAPPHADRPRWHPSLADAVHRHATALAAELASARNVE